MEIYNSDYWWNMAKLQKLIATKVGLLKIEAEKKKNANFVPWMKWKFQSMQRKFHRAIYDCRWILLLWEINNAKIYFFKQFKVLQRKRFTSDVYRSSISFS